MKKHLMPLLLFSAFWLIVSGEISASTDSTRDSNPSVVTTANGNNPSGSIEHKLDSGNDDSLNLQELLEKLSPTVTPARDIYFKMEACEGANSATLLVEVEVNKEGQPSHLGYLYFFPDLDQHFVMEFNESNLRNGGKQLKFWNESSNELIITKDQIIQNESGTRAINPWDALSCMANSLGINTSFNNLLAGLVSTACGASGVVDNAFKITQTALHCISIAGIGANLVASTAGCVVGVAKVVACGWASCANLSAQLASVNISGGGHPNRANDDGGFCTSDFPCLAGQGDCDSDGQCQSDLICNEAVGANYDLDPSTDVCDSPVNTSGGGQLAYQNGHSNFCTSEYPCFIGQGDCDGNNECQSGLFCRNYEGASYDLEPSTDVCIPLNTSGGGNPEGKNGDGNFCSSSYPCLAGQGDCDGDSGCQSGLYCHGAVGANHGLPPATDVCELPLNQSGGGHPEKTTGDGSFCSPEYPCLAGQGDCDGIGTDNECQAGLICNSNRGAAYDLSSSTDVCEPVTTTPTPTPTPSGNGSLTSGNVVSDSVAQGAWKHYQITASSSHSQLKVEMTNLLADVDLYVRKGSQPSSSNYDCRPYSGGTSSETCTQNNSGNNVWYVSVHGYQAGSFTLKATLSGSTSSSSDTSTQTTSGSAGTSCGSGQVYDCVGECVNSSTATNWTGDGYCDDGAYGMVLTCPEFNNDGGDCN